MKLLLPILFLATLVAANAEQITRTVLASHDAERIAATGMKWEKKKNMPDFTVTYLQGPGSTDVIGIFEGEHPSAFSPRGKRLGEVKGTMAGESVTWVCWSEESAGKTQYGAEAFMPSRRTVIKFGDKQEIVVTQFHVFVLRGDLQGLAAARKLAASLIRKGPSPSTAQALPPHATAPKSTR